MQCNIDAKGKRIRLISGIVVTTLGVVLLAVSLAWTPRLPWGIGLGLLLIGAFQIFEARAGWCAVRAMGIRTKY